MYTLYKMDEVEARPNWSEFEMSWEKKKVRRPWWKVLETELN